MRDGFAKTGRPHSRPPVQGHVLVRSCPDRVRLVGSGDGDEKREGGGDAHSEQEQAVRHPAKRDQQDCDQGDGDDDRAADVRDRHADRQHRDENRLQRATAHPEDRGRDREQQQGGVRERVVERPEAAQAAPDVADLTRVRVAVTDEPRRPDLLLVDPVESNDQAGDDQRADRDVQGLTGLPQRQTGNEEDERLGDQSKALGPGDAMAPATRSPPRLTT